MKTFIMIMTLWGDSMITQEFSTYEKCVTAGEAMRAIKQTPKRQPIQYICVEK